MSNTGYPISYAAINKDEQIRKISSSGGVFFLAAEEILRNRGVVLGARINEEMEVEHSYCEKSENLFPFLGSKYVQSKMKNNFQQVKKFLQEDRNVLFSGTPCQIYGLKCYLGKEYDNLYTIDLACHGVPSPMVWRKYLEENFDGKTIKKINFRDKTEGWNNFSLKIQFEEGTDYRVVRKKDPYIKGFLQNLYLRPSCYECRFKGAESISDITLADFWKIEDHDKDMFDDHGTSLVLVQSPKGEKLWSSIAKKMAVRQVDIEIGLQGNRAITHSASLTEKRAQFYQKMQKGIKVTDVSEELTKRTFMQKVKGRLKSLLNS